MTSRHLARRPLLAGVRALLHTALTRVGLEVLGAGISLELADSDDGREKVASGWEATSRRALAQLVLRNTGEAELVIADLESGDIVVNEHREITSAVGLADAIETIREHLRPQATGQGSA